MRIITDEIIDRFREIKAGTEDARQELHETREQIMEDQFGKIYFPTYIPQYPEIDFDKVSNTINKTYIGLTSMLQGFQKCIA